MASRPDTFKPISLNWDVRIYESMKELARRHRRTTSQEVMIACEEWLREHGVLVDPAPTPFDALRQPSAGTGRARRER